LPTPKDLIRGFWLAAALYTLVRPELGRALFERATAPKRFELVQGGTHYSTNGMGQAQYREARRALFGLGA
jgi:hypothetical protein